MKRLSSIVQPLRIAAVLALGACIQVDCVSVPCAQPLALTISISNATSGGAVPNAVVQLGGQMTGSIPCGGSPTTCAVVGFAGTYSVSVSAPGFQSATRTITVAGTEAAECHCATVETGRLSITLTPN